MRILTTDRYVHGRNMIDSDTAVGCEVKRVGMGRVLGGQVGAYYCWVCLEMDSE